MVKYRNLIALAAEILQLGHTARLFSSHIIKNYRLTLQLKIQPKA